MADNHAQAELETLKMKTDALLPFLMYRGGRGREEFIDVMKALVAYVDKRTEILDTGEPK